MSDSIVGAWKLEDGDYPLTREFLADGTFINRMGKLIQKSSYRLDGNEVAFLVEQPNGETLEQREKFSALKDKLTFYDDDDGEVSTRVFIRQ